MSQLKDLQDLLDKSETYRPGRGIAEPPSEEEVARCIQVLMSRQCIYPHQTHLSRSYSIMACRDYQEFFRRYFDAMGLEFHFDSRSDMISLRVPTADKRRYDWQASRLKKDETLVLLVLKLAYEEGFKNNEMTTRGEVEITTNDVLDKLDIIAGVHVEEKRLKDILTMFERKGIVDVGEVDPVERVRGLTIYPGIEVACPEVYVQIISDWADKMNQVPFDPEAITVADEPDTAIEETAHV